MELDFERVQSAYHQASGDLLGERKDGHWVGQLSTSALSTATAVSAMSAVLKSGEEVPETKRLRELVAGGTQWLGIHPNEDGGWGDTLKSHSNISTTFLAIAAFHFSDTEIEHAAAIEKGWRYIEAQGGIPGLRRRYGIDKTFVVPILANCAMAGIVDWGEVSALPFEAACVPQRFYHWMQLPVVSYAIPALVAIGQAKYFNDPPWDPFRRGLRRMAVGRSLKVLQKMQPTSGGYLEAIPLTSFVVMSLASTGRTGHPVVQRGLQFILNSVLEDNSWPIDSNLATWTTTLSINALSNCAEGRDGLKNLKCLDWVLGCQNQTAHPFTNSPPGGWGWTDLSGAVPDADDTPGALLALQNLLDCGQLSEQESEAVRNAARSGVEWLFKLQNRDRGWPTFCRGWGKLPFDRSGSDITAHCLRGIHAWRELMDAGVVDRVIRRGLSFLEKNQREDGSWLPLWFGNQDHPEEENPVYGTAKVLAAYADLDLMETSAAQRGLSWLVGIQNQDGSWGGGPSAPAELRQVSAMVNNDSPVTNDPPATNDSLVACGTVEETALAVEALLIAPGIRENRTSLVRGLNWLVAAVESNCHRIDSPIGFYFAKLWYHERLYPQIFSVAALGSALQSREQIEFRKSSEFA